MRLTAMTDYALRLLLHVGQNPDRLCTIAEVARAYGISEAHLMKVTHRLALGGWLETVRGKGGGMRLSRPPRDIPLGAVVRCMESDFALVECLDEAAADVPSNCLLHGRCGLTGVLDGALQAFMRHLDGYSLADVLPGGTPPQPIRIVRAASDETALG